MPRVAMNQVGGGGWNQAQASCGLAPDYRHSTVTPAKLLKDSEIITQSFTYFVASLRVQRLLNIFALFDADSRMCRRWIEN